MARTPTSSVTWEEFIDNLLEKNKELELENKKLQERIDELEWTKKKTVTTICFDFDWVIHWYREGWKDWSIYDEPVPWIRELIGRLITEWYHIVICSTRVVYPSDRQRIEEWLEKYNFPKIEVYCKKPIAGIYVDDRWIKFMWDCCDLYSQIINYNWTWVERWFKPRLLSWESPRR